jgi:hypothetical protein
LLTCLFSHSQVPVAVFAGAQGTSAHYTINDTKQPTDHKYGFMAGFGAKVPFDNGFYFFPSIYYSRKGYKVSFNMPSVPPTEVAKNNDVTVHTIEIAPLFQVDLSKRPDHFFVRFGPAIDYAISGTEKFDTVSTSGQMGSIKRSMVFSFGDYGRYTAAGNLHVGYETSRGLMVFAYYGLGIASMNNADYGPAILHRIAGISLGWYFKTVK